MTQPGPRPRAAAGRGLSASHLVSSANEGGGAGERQAEGHDREGDQGVEDAVHAESGHFRRSFFWRAGAGVEVAVSDVDDA